MKIYDRQTESYEEIEQFGAGKLNFLYNNPFGRLFLGIAVSSFVSDIYAKKKSKKSSCKDIPEFIRNHNIDMGDYEDKEYESFTDFFTRKIKPGKRPVDMDPKAFISPCDSKLLVYKIDSNTGMNIKGREYTVDEILGGTGDAQEFKDGIAMVFRLTVDDYHRYCFPDSGSVISRKHQRLYIQLPQPVLVNRRSRGRNTTCCVRLLRPRWQHDAARRMDLRLRFGQSPRLRSVEWNHRRYDVIRYAGTQG